MITVREMRSDDNLATVLQLCKDFFAEYETHHAEFFDTDSLTDDDISGRILESLKSNDSATIIALDDNVIVGYASVAIREQPHFYRIKKIGSISALMVAPEYRRQGIATNLLNKAKDFFRQHEIKYFTLYTATVNQAAISLYKKINLIVLLTTFLGET